VEKERRASISNAIQGLSIAGVEVMAGMYLLLQDPILGFDRREQTVWGTALLGISLPFFAQGISDLFPGSSTERAWDRYQAGEPASSPAVSHSIFTIVPTRGGVVGELRLAF
jgi:hypothetical protein